MGDTVNQNFNQLKNKFDLIKKAIINQGGKEVDMLGAESIDLVKRETANLLANVNFVSNLAQVTMQNTINLANQMQQSGQIALNNVSDKAQMAAQKVKETVGQAKNILFLFLMI